MNDESKKNNDRIIIKALIDTYPGPLYTQRDELAEREGAPYHETSEARVMAFKNGWNACLEHVMNVLDKKT